MTQGVLAYELLLFRYGEMTDEIDEMESMLNEELSEYNVPIDELDSLSWTDEASVKENLKGEFNASDEDGDSTDSVTIRLWLPERVLSDCPWERGWGDRIETAILNTYASVYTDRWDRIAIKRQLNEYLRSGVEPEAHAARVITGHEDSEEIDVSDDLRAAFTASVTSPTEYKQKARAGELTGWSDRFNSLEELAHSIETVHENVLVELIKEAHDIETESYVEDKVSQWVQEHESELDGLVSKDSEVEDDSQSVEDIQEEVTEQISKYGTGNWSDFTEYSEITQEEVKEGLIRNYLNHMWDNNRTITIGSIKNAIGLAKWDIPSRFDSVEDWVESFPNVKAVDDSEVQEPLLR